MKDKKLTRTEEEFNLKGLDSSTSDDPFEHIIEKAGSHGRFQLIYNTTFIMGLKLTGSMVYMNIILALNIPDHWCTVPGRENTNLTLSEWRRITLPTITDNRGIEKYSSCYMYDVNFTETFDWENWNSSSANVTACKNGWTYDQTWFQSTIPTKENWVCTKNLHVTNVFVFGKVAEVLGAFLLGQMGDIYGRRFVYYVSIICCSLGRLLSIAVTSHYTWFLLLTCLTSLTINSVFQSTCIIGMEISKEKDRSTITMYHNFGWSVGITIVPLLFWWLRDWESFLLISCIPTALVLLCSYYVIESPRWLISKKRFHDAMRQFKKISKINGQDFDVTEKELRQIYSTTKQEATYGIASLFDGWRLARNTCIMGFLRCVVGISYSTIILFCASMSGNPFLNFFMQSLAEIPAYLLGKYFGDKFGRRFTNSASLLVSCLASLLIIFLATDPRYEVIVAGLAAFIKFLNALTYSTASLQGMEIYPTCMRQTGIALGSILENCAGVLAPYLVYLGTTADIRDPYYILAALFSIGTVVSLYLPETLHKKLPDTIEEARQFGINDKIFRLPKASAASNNTMSNKQEVDSDALEKLNHVQYAP